MVKITDFGSALQIVFALNFVFYLFEIRPYLQVDTRIHAEFKRSFFFGNAILLSLFDSIIKLYTLLIAIMSFGCLLVVGFFPNVEAPTWTAVVGSGLGIAVIPLAMILHRTLPDSDNT